MGDIFGTRELLSYISTKSQAKGDGLKLWVGIIISYKIITGNYWNRFEGALESSLASKDIVWRHFDPRLG